MFIYVKVFILRTRFNFIAKSTCVLFFYFNLFKSVLYKAKVFAALAKKEQQRYRQFIYKLWGYVKLYDSFC